jgi:serine protease AprX
MNVFATGRDSSVYHKWWDGATWGPNGTAGAWESLGGAALGPPKAVSWAPNRIDLFVLGQDSSLYHKSWDGSTWTPNSGFEFIGGSCHGAVEAVSRTSGVLDVFVLGIISPFCLGAINQLTLATFRQ